ncbi:aminodeoxychorismate lyase [Rhodococcus antarcticus]|uniref:Aminodeoxychorismate lyase n=1 Tax=Rhodococcus antarcticus TaxID=2987751 RepID=A0ABY6P095_9NOCA|nr:aminodeoxychorismate lyase [Rhodococcus antarcticus]UZJ25079.1 aminodeoxychorismate lyase [Rhodococcus antarcticus]
MTVQVLVTLDGTVRDPEVPLLAADDLAAVRGDGVFETLLVRDGVVREQEAHLARLVRSARALELGEPDLDAWRACIAVVRERWASIGGGREEDLVVRLVLSRGREGTGTTTAWATGSPVSETAVHQRAHGVSVLRLERGFASDVAERAPWLLLGAKTLSYAVNMAALRHAAERGADDVVHTSADGFVLEGPTSTVVVATGRALRTPPADTGILPGTTQQALFRAATVAGWDCRVEPVRADELEAADGVWLLSSVRLLARVHTLDGTPLHTASGVHGELTALLG